MFEVKDVRAGYGDINILLDVSLNFPKGKLTTIIGTNGAGKTTLLKTIMGLLPVTKGSISLDGKSLKPLQTWDMNRLNISLIPEGRMVFKDMTVEENLLIGAYPKKSRRNRFDNLEKIYNQFPRLKERYKQVAGSLSGGEAQMLAMGRGLMSDPDIILIDEPSLGLAPKIVNDIFMILEALKKEKKTIILVEQNTYRAVGVADNVYLMQSGKVVFSASAEEVDLEEIHKIYFAKG